MRANITINDAGIILAASNAPPPIGGAAVSRVNQKMSITLGAKPALPALLSLIRALRAVKTTIGLYHSDENDGTQIIQTKVCIHLAQMALSSLESEHRNLFQSKIELVTPQLLTVGNVPDDLSRLARMPLDTPDVLSALIKVYDARMKNLVLAGQSLSMKLCFIVVPENLAWPKPPPLLAQSLEHCLDLTFNYWLAIIYETAMAIRGPFYQHGMIRIDQWPERQFKRIIYPIIPANERASNHRILSTVRLLDDPYTPII
ncbi:hypothetical protein N8524_00500 [Candidatus Puniceispirillum sp.]|nr:hypothetical protein [Candidatus Puniceispirillum sp.]